MVPFYEDVDYPFFERVLQARPDVMHFNARGAFFLDLATAGKWVNSTHMEVLMGYSDRRYGLPLHLNHSMFVAPWFTAHMQRKDRSFKAARRKKRVAGDARITKYLTKFGSKWGAEIDTLYAPMIWEGMYWVGLRISLSQWNILVLDPNPQLKTMEKVEELVEPVASILSYIAKKMYIKTQNNTRHVYIVRVQERTQTGGFRGVFELAQRNNERVR
ncbi:unnamed protein product, partial [Brassica oleracea]